MEWTTFEYPMNEHMRSLLRVEFLFAQFQAALRHEGEWSARQALEGLHQIQEFCSRKDKELRAELSRSLRTQYDALRRHIDRPAVDAAALDATLKAIDQSIDRLTESVNERSEPFAQHEFLASTKKRMAIPAGSCSFDLPILQPWLLAPAAQRQRCLSEWLEPWRPIGQAASLILKILRASELPSNETAAHGFFQQSASDDPNSKPQLLRVMLSNREAIFPEFSGNWHRYSIRFMTVEDWSRRPVQVAETVAFRFSRCRF